MAASKAMRNGDWRKARDFIVNDKMNAKVFTFSNVYDSISITQLAEMFELEDNCVHALVSKMIIAEELMASLDQPTQCIVMHRTEPSRVQALVSTLA